MGRNSAISWGLLAAVGFGCQSATADDQKSATRAAKAVLVAPMSPPAPSIADESRSAVTVGLFENGYSVTTPRASTREKDKPPREHKTITLFHFKSQFGDVAVQPVFGHVNGAQLSVGF